MDIEGQVGEGEQEGDDQQSLVRFPADRLLMPQARDDAKHGQRNAGHVQQACPLSVRLSLSQLAVLDAVADVDIQSDQHPEHQPDPGVGRQEDHHDQAGDDPGDRDERHQRSLERAGSVGHRTPDNQDTGADQREGEQGADAAHLARYLRRDEGRQRADQHHEQEIAAGGRPETWVDMREERRQQAVAAHAEEDPALAKQRDHDHGAVAQQDGDDNRPVHPGIVRLDRA